MSRRSTTTIIAASLAAALAASPVALARDDDDVFAGDPASPVVVYEADGSVVPSASTTGTRAFVADLVRRGAAGGSYSTTTANGPISDFSRTGYARPTVQRYKRLQRPSGGQGAALSVTSGAITVVGDSVVTERGWAVDLATGKVRRISLDAAKRLSLDPREGRPNTEYFYFRNVKPVGAGL